MLIGISGGQPRGRDGVLQRLRKDHRATVVQLPFSDHHRLTDDMKEVRLQRLLSCLRTLRPGALMVVNLLLTDEEAVTVRNHDGAVWKLSGGVPVDLALRYEDVLVRSRCGDIHPPHYLSVSDALADSAPVALERHRQAFASGEVLCAPR